MLEGGFKGASRGLEGSLQSIPKHFEHELHEVWACVKYVPRESIALKTSHIRFGHL